MPISEANAPIVLCILDGWGHRLEVSNNAILAANTPTWDTLLKSYPHSLLSASGTDVGLPHGQMGNSEVGHMHLGSGRMTMQELPRIDSAIKDDTIKESLGLNSLIRNLTKSSGKCHVMGLLSPGGVHSHQKHLTALVNLLDQNNVPVVVHAFLDGRDTPPFSAESYCDEFESSIELSDNIKIGTICGRYWAMDRDQRWERIKTAYSAICEGSGEEQTDIKSAIQAGYQAGESDEFISPRIVSGYSGMKDGDGILMVNFRADRVRQLLTALIDPNFDEFLRGRLCRFAGALGMTEYSNSLSQVMDCIFPHIPLKNVLGEIISDAGKRQLRLAETEKYAHVSFFLNGGREDIFTGEERILVPSPKVKTYDLKPEMSSKKVTDELVKAILNKRFDFIVVNFANTDMVGHSGIFSAAVEAVEAVDFCLGRMMVAVESVGGTALITSDHGNAEQMKSNNGDDIHTAHTINPVPFILAGNIGDSVVLRDGILSDVAPTILSLMSLKVPVDMTGTSLIISPS